MKKNKLLILIIFKINFLNAQELPSGCDNQLLLLGNKKNFKAEIYQIHSIHTPIKKADCIWQSPPSLNGVTDVKHINYMGHDAILVTERNGVVIYSYPSKQILFRSRLLGHTMNVHSALAMKDGNVVVIDSYGWVLILYRNGLQGFANTFKIHLKYPHGVVWDKEYQMLYVLAYTDIIKYKYIGQGANASLELVHDYDFKKYYERCSFYGICDEDAATEDGGHDFFPVKGDNPHLFFLTTGERVFLFDSSQQLDTLNLNSAQNTEIMLKNYSALFQIDSKYSQQITPNAIKEQVILQKGGIKSISGNLNSAKYCVIATPRPWFTSNLYYPYDSTVLVYIDNPNSIVDFDLSTHNHIYFESDLNSEVNFYKARLF